MSTTPKHAGSDRLLFVDLPVTDLGASRALFAGLGFSAVPEQSARADA